jgi:hypothetical protein
MWNCGVEDGLVDSSLPMKKKESEILSDVICRPI